MRCQAVCTRPQRFATGSTYIRSYILKDTPFLWSADLGVDRDPDILPGSWRSVLHAVGATCYIQMVAVRRTFPHKTSCMDLMQLPGAWQQAPRLDRLRAACVLTRGGPCWLLYAPCTLFLRPHVLCTARRALFAPNASPPASRPSVCAACSNACAAATFHHSLEFKVKISEHLAGTQVIAIATEVQLRALLPFAHRHAPF